MKRVTCTTRIMDVLQRADDFLTTGEVGHLSGCTVHQTNTTLHHLKKHKAVDTIVNKEGRESQIFWFCTVDKDDRHYLLDEREEEEKPRNCKRRKK